MFGFLGLLAVAFAIAFERLAFAISVLMMALWMHRKYLAFKARWGARTAALRSAVSHRMQAWKRIARWAFGPTVRV